MNRVQPFFFVASLLLLVSVLGGCGKKPGAPPGALGSPSVLAPTPAPGSTRTPTPAATRAPVSHAEVAHAEVAHAEAASSPAAPGVAWLHAATISDIDAAFAQARRQARPVFVYWGAAWCPPCNQLKATLFNRQDFIARSRSFLPVYVDGDSPGAQKLGARYKVSGYPTLVLFDPQGVELTRLPGEVDPARYESVLTLAMSARQPVAQVLATALAGGAGLTPEDWRLLSFYSWETDEQRLVPKSRLSAVLQRLATACPAAQLETAQRLELQALAAAGGGRTAPARPAGGAQARLLKLLGDENAARLQLDLLVNSAVEITRALAPTGSVQRQQLLTAFDSALLRMEADSRLSRADRLSALASRVELARMDEDPTAATGAAPPAAASGARLVPPALPSYLPPALLADVRDTAARVDREITDGYERQAVVTSAADLLDRAGLQAESDVLLRANLGRSHAPYYLMSALGRHAKSRGDRAEALHWYREAFDKSEGPATRLQWGASYLGALIDLRAEDEGAIEATTAQLFREAGASPDAFDGRSDRSLQRVGAKLQAWNKTGRHAAVVRRLQAQLGGVCAALPTGDASRTNCTAVLPAKGAVAAT